MDYWGGKVNSPAARIISPFSAHYLNRLIARPHLFNVDLRITSSHLTPTGLLMEGDYTH